MFLTLSKASAGLLCLALFGASGATAQSTTVYRGTFVHLPKLNSSSTKPELARNQGVLWVSSDDGRIQGYDWGVNDDASFQSFLSSNGWTESSVKVVKSDDTRNEFFFPGFIGTLHPEETQPHISS